MCTIVDKDASKKFYLKIKKTGVTYAWKLVAINEKGDYFAPFIMTKYNKKLRNATLGMYYIDAKKWWDDDAETELTHSVFHLFFSREKARKALKWIENPKCCFRDVYFTYKIVKVMFSAQDFVAVGHPSSFFRYDAWGFFDKNPDNICVTAFQFVK